MTAVVLSGVIGAGCRRWFLSWLPWPDWGFFCFFCACVCPAAGSDRAGVLSARPAPHAPPAEPPPPDLLRLLLVLLLFLGSQRGPAGQQ